MEASHLDLAGRILIAIALGGVIGIEREADGHPAGLRTHITVALGAALFGIVSVDGFDRFVVGDRSTTNVQVDVTRVASQVVVGIGFLGAGTIIKHNGAVRGLTTAASLWVACAIGLAVGVGAAVPAAMTTLAMVVTLVGLRFPRRWVRDFLSTKRRTVTLRLEEGADIGAIVDRLEHLHLVEARNLSIRGHEGGRIVEVDLKPLPGGDIGSAVDEMDTYEGVTGIEVD